MVRGALAAGVLIAVNTATAGSLPLRWDAVQSANLQGYRVLWGSAAGNYTNQADVGNVTSYAITNLPDCAAVYACVRSISTSGAVSSACSNEVSGWPQIVIAPAAERSFETGGTYSVTIQGQNFKPNALIWITAGTTQIMATAVTTTCSSASFTLTIPATAPTGRYALTVENPDATRGYLQGFAAVGSATPPAAPAGLRRTDKP